MEDELKSYVIIFGYIAVCLASPVAWIGADAFLIPAYQLERVCII